ncbi:hypothetical protein N7460_006995 [Penicillium canescens]|uniref:Uncharacterized protein n=1 Tax=Penicillium canescens TaxID=5083 RepID=A0AAD6IC65_PENCN|nr:hypothetical protein N7460_006995 [Penicillium canescens]KAJ6064706.1 hypothetical protein N7444_000359 [Penicillium canescens]
MGKVPKREDLQSRQSVGAKCPFSKRHEILGLYLQWLQKTQELPAPGVQLAQQQNGQLKLVGYHGAELDIDHLCHVKACIAVEMQQYRWTPGGRRYWLSPAKTSDVFEPIQFAS